MRSLRAPLGALVIVGISLCAVQLATGHWLPVALQVATPLTLDSSKVGSNVEIGKADAAFRVEQRSVDGSLVWRLTGARISSETDLITYGVEAPVFHFSRDGVTASFTAQSSRVTVPKEEPDGDERRFIRLELSGDVRLEATRTATATESEAHASLRSDGLVIWLDRDTGGQQKPGGARFRSTGSVAVVVSSSTQPGPLSLSAASAEGTLLPLDTTLSGPVAFETIASIGSSTPGWAVSGVARRRVRILGTSTSPDSPLTPDALTLTADDVTFRAEEPKASRVEATAPSQVWLGQTGRVFVSLQLGAADAANAVNAVRLDGGFRLRPDGAPDADAGVRASSLSWKGDGPRAQMHATDLDARLDMESGRRKAPWTVRATSLDASVVREALATRPLAWRDAVLAAELTGDVFVEGLGTDPRKQRGVAAERLTYTKESGLLSAFSGDSAPLTVRLGRSTVRASEATYAFDTERLDARGRLHFVTRLPPRTETEKEQTITASAEHGWAILSSDPERWKAHQQGRRALKQANRPDWYPPEPIASLALFGKGKRRVVVRGPKASRLEADQVTFDAAEGLGRLSATQGATVLLEADGRKLQARTVELKRERPTLTGAPKPTTVSALGAVRVRGALPEKPGSHLELSCGTFRCELAELGPHRPTRVGPFSARDAVRLLIVSAEKDGEQRVGLTTETLVGNGSVALPDGRRGVRCVLETRWDADVSLPKKGPARIHGGALEAVVDLEATQAEPKPGESETERLRRSLHSLKVSGGLEIAADGLLVSADEAELDPVEGLYRLKGDPSVISRGSLRQEAREQVIRLADE
jgi:hypothetical protein